MTAHDPGKKPANRPALIVIGVFAVAGLIYGLLNIGPVSIPLPNIALTGHPAGQAKPQNLPPGYYRVTSIDDGDTIKVDLDGREETVRLIGIDTPETKDPRKPIQCYGREATIKTTEILAGQPVRLEADPEDDDRDKYRRLLRYVYLPDGRLLNAELVEQGHAFAYVLFPFTKKAEFMELEQLAKAGGRGLWSVCPVEIDGDKKQTAPTAG